MLVENLSNFEILADTVEVLLAIALMVGGVILTHMVQKWADRAGETPPAANSALGGAAERYEERGLRR